MITVTGTLSDAGGVALPCALLELRVLRSAGETFFNSTVQVKTDNDGNYSFSLKRGEYEVFAQVSRRSDVERIGTCVVNDGVQGELTLEELMALTSPLLPESVIEVRGHMDEVRAKHTEIHQWHGETAQSKEAISRLEQQTLQHNNEAQASAAISQAQAALSTAEREEAGRQASVALDAVNTATLKANESAQHAQFSSQHRQASEGAQLASEVAANKAQGHEHQASNLLQQTTSQAHAASESALAVSGVELRVSEAEQRVAQHVLATQKNKEDAQIAAGVSASSASKSESHALGAADKLANTISQANRATTEADRAEAAASSVDEMLYAMSVAEFEARREANKRKYAGSGFVEWGKHLDNDYNLKPVNQGMSIDDGTPNVLYFGAKTHAQGLSRSLNPIVNVNGIELWIDNVVANNSNWECNRIKLPPPPDGTKTYDSATGEVIDFAKDVDPKYGDIAADRNEAVARAFEGLVRNGDFRFGVDHWISHGTSFEIENGILNFIDADDSVDNYAYQYLNIKDVTTLIFEVVVTDIGSGELNIELAYGGTAPHGSFTIRSSGTHKFVVDIPPDTQNSLNLRLRRGSGPNLNVFKIASISAYSATKSVITSRKDLVLLEVWDEVVHGDRDSKGVIYPLGNVQYGLSTYEGIPLQNNNVAQGYSAFGEWDTETKGYSARISDLTFAQLCKFLQDPRSNLRYDAETRKLIHTHYRFRVVEGRGNNWTLASPSDYLGGTAALGYSANKEFVQPRGLHDGSIMDLGADGENSVFLCPRNSGFIGDTSDILTVTRGNRRSGLVYALPIALVQRMNSGAYHPIYNVMGCDGFISPAGGSIARWWDPKFYEPSTSKDCFIGRTDYPATGGCKYNYGNIVNKLSGRPSNDPYQFYDSINAGQVEDLRLSAHKQDLNRLREDAVRRAVAGTLRGKEKAPFTYAILLGEQTFCAYGNNGFRAGNLVDSLENGYLPRAFASYFGITGFNSHYFMQLISGGASSSTDAAKILNKAEAYLTFDVSGESEKRVYRLTTKAVGLDVMGVLPVGNTPSLDDSFKKVVSNMVLIGTINGYTGNKYSGINRVKLNAEFDVLSWIDIMGNPERIASAFPNGLAGKWIPEIMRPHIDKEITANKKFISMGTRVITENDGSSWSSFSDWVGQGGGDSIKNLLSNRALRSERVTLCYYATNSAQTVPAKRLELSSGPSNVIATNSHEISKGNRLHGSLTGTIGKGSSVDIATHTNIRDAGNKYNAVELSLQNETDALIAEMGIVVKDGLIYGQFAAKQAVHNGTDWGDNQVIQKVDNETIDTDDNGKTIKVVNHHTIFPLGIASYTDSAMATE